MEINLPRSLLADHGAPEASAARPPPPPLQAAARLAVLPFRPSVAVIVVVLTTMFSLTFLLLLYAKHCRRQAAAAAAALAGGVRDGSALGGAPEHRNSGIDRAVVDSLPLFRFASLMGEKEGLECAVCLGRFEPEELLRLLPKCRHAFHVDCVDAWLDSHSTCPLCRSRIHPEDVLLLRHPDPLPPPSLALPPARRISGRHSSAGEKSSGWAVTVDLERQRKDGLLLPAAPEVEGSEGRYSHRVVFSGRGGGALERWSDLRPSDLMFLRSETLTTMGSEGFSAAGGGSTRIGRTSVSEISRLRRFGAPEDGMMRRWLGFGGKRTAGWLSGGNTG
ncbi:RING-H2 finger protein ATL43 [Platanthera zijinensis]|uniref:RING-type E3 ubiquitin transferase n=1 Tax=Platanthera zijinensis TaxID=2320716 RepID=A0AAP0BZ31_9ASPA